MKGVNKMFQNPTNKEISHLLEKAQTIAVIGLSPNENRTSHQISKAMQEAGYKIIPVNPLVDEVLGEKSYNSISEISEHVDIVNVFRRSEFLNDIAKEMVQTDIPVIWTQQGVYDESVAQQLKEHDKTVIMDLCIKVTHAVLIK